MTNTSDICSVSCQIEKVAGNIGSYASAIRDRGGAVSDDLADIYEELLLDEIRHAQILMLKLTDLVTEQSERSRANSDEDEDEPAEGAFAQGELTSEAGKNKPDKEPAAEA